MMNCFWQSISKLGKIKKVGTLFLKIRQLSAILILFCFVAHGEMFDFKHEQRMSNSWFKHDYLHFFSKLKPGSAHVFNEWSNNPLVTQFKKFYKGFSWKNAYHVDLSFPNTWGLQLCSNCDVTM